MEDFKSIRLLLDFADENGKLTKKEQTIKINKPTLKDRHNVFNKNAVYTLSFTIQIPQFIHSYLIGKTVPSRIIESTITYDKNFAKSINGYSIEEVTQKWCDLIDNYVWLKRMEYTELKKVIFYEIISNHGENRTSWSGISFGDKASISYKYFVGFINTEEKYLIRYNSERLAISRRDSDFYKLRHIDWSEERELFFSGLQKSFIQLIEKISNFQNNISEDTINNLIKSKALALNVVYHESL